MAMGRQNQQQSGTPVGKVVTSDSDPRAQQVTRQVNALINQFLGLSFGPEWSEENAADLSSLVSKFRTFLSDKEAVALAPTSRRQIVDAVGSWLAYSGKLFSNFSSDLFSDAAIDFVTFAGTLGVYDFAERFVDLSEAVRVKCSELDGEFYSYLPQRAFGDSGGVEWEPEEDSDTATLSPDSDGGPSGEILGESNPTFEDINEQIKSEDLERWQAVYGPLLTAVRQSHGALSDAFADFWVETVQGMDYVAPEWPEAMKGLLTCPQHHVRPILSDLVAASAQDGHNCALLLTAMSAGALSENGPIMDCTSIVIELMSSECDDKTRKSIIERGEQIFRGGLGPDYFETFEELAREKLARLKQQFVTE